MVDANVYDLITKDHHIEKYMDDIWIFILIIIILFIFKIKSLLFQYFLIISVLFIYSPLYGLLYGNIFFLIYNFELFNICNNFIFYSLVSGIIFNLFFIVYLKIYSKKINMYFASPLIILISLSFNFYFLYYYTNVVNEEKRKMYFKINIENDTIGGNGKSNNITNTHRNTLGEKKEKKKQANINDIKNFCNSFNYYK